MEVYKARRKERGAEGSQSSQVQRPLRSGLLTVARKPERGRPNGQERGCFRSLLRMDGVDAEPGQHPAGDSAGQACLLCLPHPMPVPNACASSSLLHLVREVGAGVDCCHGSS